MTRTMRRMRKYLIVVACIALIAGVAIGGTIAWLQDDTTPVVNTFTPTNLTADLTETTGNSYEFIPGQNLPKDPKVTTTSDVDYYVFVKVDVEGWAPTDNTNKKFGLYNDANGNAQVTFEITDKLSYLADSEYVYYAEVAKDTTFSEYILKGDANNANGVVTVASTLTDEDMYSFDEDENAYVSTVNGDIKLTFTAYAIQKAGFSTPALAWAELSGN